MAGLIIIAVGVIITSVFGYLFIVHFNKNPQSQARKIKDLHEYKYSTGMGRFAAGKERKASEARTNLAAQLNAEDEQLRIKETRESEAELAASQYSTEIAKNQHEQNRLYAEDKLTQQALIEGRHLDDHRTITTATSMSGLKISEHKQLEEINLNSKLEEMRERVRLAIIAKNLTNEQIVSAIQELIDNAYKQIHKITIDTELPPEIKTRMIEDREDIITAYKAKRNERATGLLEANNRGILRADDLDAEL